MQGVSYGKPKAKKQLQSQEARKKRVDFAKDRAKEAKFLKSLPKETRRAERLAQKSMYNSLASGGKGASARMHINEGMTILRANFNKRKGLSPGQVASMNKSIQYSAKKLGVVLANPKPGRRLTAETLRKYAQPNKAISKAKPPSTIAKPKGLKPEASMSKKPADSFRPGQTKRLKRMQGVSYGKPAAKAKSDAGSFRPGEFYRGNFRPRNVTGKPVKNENPFGLKNQAKKTGNLDIALKWLKEKGYDDAGVFKQRSKKGGQAIARAVTKLGGTRTYKDLKTGELKSESYPTRTKIEINQYSQFWKNPAKEMREQRKQGWLSTSSPLGALWHEMGHAKDKKSVVPSWARPWNGQTQTAQTRDAAKKIAQRVSRYATYSPGEFVAETYAGRRTGRKYDYQVMDAYREARGLPQLRLKGQKPIRRKRKP